MHILNTTNKWFTSIEAMSMEIDQAFIAKLVSHSSPITICDNEHKLMDHHTYPIYAHYDHGIVD